MNPLPWIADALGADRYHPSTVALASDPVMKMLFVSGWCAVFVACFAIGPSLLFGAKDGIRLTRRAVVLFAVFIMLMGADHLMSAATVFVAIYRLKVVVLAAAAAVSLTLAVLAVGQIFDIRVDPREGE